MRSSYCLYFASQGQPGFLGIRYTGAFLNRVYGILQLKYGYSVYHFL